MKKCAECKSIQPLENFAKNKAKRDGLSDKCRECKKRYNAEHYKKTKDRFNPGRYERRNQEAKKSAEFIKQYKESTPCADCNIKYPAVVMDFDHLRDKSFTIGVAKRSKGIERLKEEIEKCEVVCANCHRLRTWNRMQGHKH